MPKYWPLWLLPASRFFRPESTHVLQESHPAPDDWARLGRADAEHRFQLHIGVRQGNFAGLEKRLLEISDPAHQNYGAHLSAAQVRAYTAPTDEAVARVHAWLAAHGIGAAELRHSPARDWISVPNMTVARAEALLRTEYHVYRRATASVVRATQWSLPADVHGFVDTVHPTSAFFPVRRRAATGRASPAESDAIIDVANPPPDLTPEQACNETAVTPLCLRVLCGTLNYTARAADSSRNAMALCNFSGEFNNRTDARLFLQTYRPDAAPAADSFGIVEIAGGVNRQGPSTQDQLDRGAGKEGGLDAQVLLGLGHPVPLVTYTVGSGAPPPWTPDPSAPTNDNEPFLLLIEWLLAQTLLPTVLSISYADTEYTVPASYARRVCGGFAQLGARGVSVVFGSGDWGVGRPAQCHDRRSGDRRFAARFPDGCPWVTSVGATRGVRPQVVGYNEDNHFVSGGGFSEYFARPAYQDAAVARYLARLGQRQHAGLYNARGRAYPDVAAMGTRIVTVWDGRQKVVDGTSASAPVFAAVVALLNDARLAEKKPPLGFLNPWIYAVGDKGGFVDVVNGSTTGCNTTGFPAMEGWDVASGFGTPWFPRLKELATLDGPANDGLAEPIPTGTAPTGPVVADSGAEKSEKPWYIPSWLQ